MTVAVTLTELVAFPKQPVFADWPITGRNRLVEGVTLRGVSGKVDNRLRCFAQTSDVFTVCDL